MIIRRSDNITNLEKATDFVSIAGLVLFAILLAKYTDFRNQYDERLIIGIQLLSLSTGITDIILLLKSTRNKIKFSPRTLIFYYSNMVAQYFTLLAFLIYLMGLFA